MRRRIWTVTDGTRAIPLAYFSGKQDAERYVAALVERYSLGTTLGLFGKQLAPDAGSWSLGLGPTVTEQTVDENLDSLPGAWVVKVDESCRMIACVFSTQDKPTKQTVHYRTGIHAICEGYAPTPHIALDRARKAMVSYLGKDHSWR